MTTFGERLKAARKACNLSQEQVAREADVGQSFLSELENGKKTEIGAGALHRLAKMYGTSVEYLLDGAGQKSSTAQTEIEAAVLAAFRQIAVEDHQAAIKMLMGLVVAKTPSATNNKRHAA